MNNDRDEREASREQAAWDRTEALRRKAETEGLWGAAQECGVPPFFAKKKISRDDVADNKTHLSAIDHVMGGGSLFLFGGVGAGKTHLVSVLAVELLRGHVEAKRAWAQTGEPSPSFIPDPDDPKSGFFVKPKRWIEFWSVPRLYGELRDSLRKEQGPCMEDYIKDCIRAEVLILDDLGAHKSTEWVEETLFRIVDGRYGEMRQTIYTSNLSLEDLMERVGERTVDRIAEVCRIVRMAGPSRRRRR